MFLSKRKYKQVVVYPYNRTLAIKRNKLLKPLKDINES